MTLLSCSDDVPCPDLAWECVKMFQDNGIHDQGECQLKTSNSHILENKVQHPSVKTVSQVYIFQEIYLVVLSIVTGILLLYCFLYGCCLQSFNAKILVLFLLQFIFWLLIIALVLFAIFYAEGLINFRDGRHFEPSQKCWNVFAQMQRCL